MQAATEIAVPVQKRAKRARFAVLGLAVLAAAAFVAAIGYGAVPIPPAEVLTILAAHLGLLDRGILSPTQDAVVTAIRLPRAILGVLVGGGLAVSGAALQGLFRNPLADPGLIGVSTGAALAAATTIVAGGILLPSIPSGWTTYVLPVSAFFGGLFATFLVYRIAYQDGRTDVSIMLLAGVALNAIAGAGIGLLIFLSDDQQMRDLNFWLLGSLGGVTWERLLVAAPFILLPILLLPLQARRLNALLLGEVEAGHLGLSVERAKREIVVLSAMAVGAAVALSGVIGFVGLMVPHLIRLLMGPDHRSLLPGTIFLGAALLLVADMLARTLVLPAELPIGILTSCVGGPFFLWLLLRQRRRWWS